GGRRFPRRRRRSREQPGEAVPAEVRRRLGTHAGRAPGRSCAGHPDDLDPRPPGEHQPDRTDVFREETVSGAPETPPPGPLPEAERGSKTVLLPLSASGRGSGGRVLGRPQTLV